MELRLALVNYDVSNDSTSEVLLNMVSYGVLIEL
jgi:hypothetical protein